MNDRKQQSVLRGSVNLLLGPMKSGKTQELVCKLHRHRIARHNVIALKSAIDMRNERDRAGLLSSRDGSDPFVAVVVKQLSDYSLDGVVNSVIGIDEAQFYDADALVAFCQRAAAQHNIVYVAALAGDSELRPWSSVSALLPHADSIELYRAICERCGDEAPFTMRVGGSLERVAVDAEYIPTCRVCWRSAEKK